MRCVVCNKKIPGKHYFCDDCLKEKIGKPPRRKKPGLLSLLFLLPFHMLSASDDSEKLRWAVRRMGKITTDYPNLSLESKYRIARTICSHIGLNNEEARRYILAEAQRIKLDKDGSVYAPWDVVLQPALSILFILIWLLGSLWFISIL